MKDIVPSAIFEDDKVYETHMRNAITIINGVIARGEDLVIDNGLATRVLLDFYQETLRRHLTQKNETKDEEKGSN